MKRTIGDHLRIGVICGSRRDMGGELMRLIGLVVMMAIALAATAIPALARGDRAAERPRLRRRTRYRAQNRPWINSYMRLRMLVRMALRARSWLRRRERPQRMRREQAR